MATVPINITGQTYESRSRVLSNQLTQNWYAELVDNPTAKSQYVLHPTPGLKSFGTADSGDDRGLFEHQGILYHVSGTSIYTVSASGTHIDIGTIPGTGRCIFAGMGSKVLIVTQGKAYQYDGSSVAEITDSDLETPNSVAHLNNQALYDGDGGRFCSSDVGDATSINALNFATAESHADDLLRVFVFDQTAYLFGERTIETWWNSGVGKPPFDRVEGGIHQVGLGALHSVDRNDHALYFLGDDSHIYRIVSGTLQQVSDISMHREIASHATVSDALGVCFTMAGQFFYCFILPAQNKSYLFSESTGWTSLSSSGGRTFVNSYAYAHRKHLVSDYRSGAVYEWDLDTHDDLGEAIIRIRDTAPLHGEILGVPGKRIEMNAFELVMETGVGTATGQGLDPVVSLQVSDDGGKTFSTEMWEKVGTMGAFQTGVRWTQLGSFHERILRVRASDPVFYSIHSATADLEGGI